MAQPVPRKPPMRISDDRYSRERERMELALRFLRHEARTQTIRVWTGLSDDRIRKLYRSYLSQARRYLPRHRGKSPHQIAYFTRSLRLQEETAVLASVLSLLGVVPAAAPAPPATAAAADAALPGLTRGELLCQAFEVFRLLLPAAQISFEHAVFLAPALPSLRGSASVALLMPTSDFRRAVASDARCGFHGNRGRGDAAAVLIPRRSAADSGKIPALTCSVLPARTAAVRGPPRLPPRPPA